MQRKQENTTTMARKKDIRQSWYLLDASGKTLGRFCSEVAKILRGKHKPNFTPNIDTGDGVIVINADKIAVTGAKKAQKLYRYYTGHIGGMREIQFRNMKPEYIIKHAVKGMMPKSRLGDQQVRKLRVVAGDQHPYEAQQPIKVDI